MNLLFRLIKVVIKAIRGPRVEPLGDSLISLRVWPNDLDMNLHMNNGRYLTLMDLGRIDLTIRTGIGRVALRERWRPMVAAATIRFRRGLPPFQRYDLRTRMLCWDQKWFFMEQRFEVAGEVYATALIKGVFVGPREKISPQVVAQAIGHDGVSPPMPEQVAAWLKWEPSA
jgi:acyl-CoA thioesterase FadM